MSTNDMDDSLVTYFFNTNKEQLGSCPGIIPIPLYKGMKISITKQMNEFEVVDWNFHYGHPDEKAGLRIFLKETSTQAPYREFEI